MPLGLLPDEINGVRIIGIDVPGFGVPTHAEAKDVLAAAMLEYARKEVEQGPVQAPRGGRGARPTGTLVGEMFQAETRGVGMVREARGVRPDSRLLDHILSCADRATLDRWFRNAVSAASAAEVFASS